MNEVGIKIKVDGSSVPAETAKVSQALQGVGDQAEKYLKGLMTEYQLLGKTASEVAAYTAKQQGLSAEVQRQAKLIGEKIDLYHREEAAAKQLAQTQDAAERRELAAINAQITARERYMSSLTQQSATLGMSSGQKKQYDAEQLGFNPEQMAQIKQHTAKIDLYQREEAAAKALAKTQDDAARREIKAIADKTAAQERYLNSLAHQNATTGLSWGDKKRFDAEQLGLNSAQLALAKQHIADIEAKTVAATGAIKKMGQASEISAGQTRNAMRMLPMQMTDVVTQLAGGQNPLLILVQQGGQVKDSFGGIGPAIRGIGAALNPVTLGIGAAAIAAGALTYAFYTGGQEAQAFNKAIAFTGNVAGVTTNQLTDMSRRIGDTVGTQGAAAEALALIAGSGKIAADRMEHYGEIAVRVNKAVGKEVSDTVKEFSMLADAPVTGSIKLNETYHYLTASVLAQIDALEKQGKAQEAVKLAQDTYADASERMSKQVIDNVGNIESAWRSLKGTVAGVWDDMKNVGRKATPAEELATLQAQLTATQSLLKRTPESNRRSDYGNRLIEDPAAASQRAELLAREKHLQTEIYNRHELQRLEGRQSAVQQEQNRVREDGVIAFQNLSKASADAASKQEKYNAALAKERDFQEKLRKDQPDSPLLAPAEIAKREAALREKYKETSSKKKDPQIGIDKSTLNFDLEQIKASAAEMIGAYDNAEKIMQARRAANLINEDEYYASKLSFINLNSQAQEQALTKEIARLGKENLSGKEKIDNDRKVIVVEKELAKVRADTLTKTELATIAHTAANDKITKSYQDATTAAQVYLDTVARQNARDIDGIGKGTRYRSEQSGINQIDDKYITKKQSLNDDLRRGDIDQEKFDKYAEIADAAYAKEVAAYTWRNDQITAKEADWLTGANEAFANYQDSAKNVAKSTEDLFTNGFKGMEDAAVKFAQTGKFSIKDLVNSAIADFARMGARAGVSGFSGLLQTGINFLTGSPSTPYTAGVGTQGDQFNPFSLSVRSASQGFDIPRGLNPLMQLHEEEVVLPSHISKPLKAMLANGGTSSGSNSMHVEIHNYEGHKVVQHESGPPNNRKLTVMIGEAVAGEVGRAGSATNNSLKQGFGIKPALIRR